MNGTPEQLFDAGMNALTGSAGTRNDLAAVDYFRRSAQKNYGPAQVVLGYRWNWGDAGSSTAFGCRLTSLRMNNFWENE